MKKLSKKFTLAVSKLDRNKLYSLKEAVKLLPETAITKFDSSVEVHVNLNVDVRHADQIVRGTVIPPHGTGKIKKIAAFVEADQVHIAKEAGAEIAGLEDLIADILKGNINFDVAVAQPQVMKELGKIAKTLGQKGLMPNPKSGTVTPDIANAIREIKKGKVEYKTDKTGIIHCIAGKVSFGTDKLEENIKTILDAIMLAKPSGVKGIYVNSITLATTMGPGIKIDLKDIK